MSVPVNLKFIPPDFNYYRSVSRSEVTLPDCEDANLFTGCRKSANVNRFYDRTAGIMALVRPCGIIHRDVYL